MELKNVEAELARFRMTRKMLASEVGVTVRTVSNWMNGKTDIPLSILIEMTEMWDCSADYLIGLSEDRKRVH